MLKRLWPSGMFRKSPTIDTELNTTNPMFDEDIDKEHVPEIYVPDMEFNPVNFDEEYIYELKRDLLNDIRHKGLMKQIRNRSNAVNNFGRKKHKKSRKLKKNKKSRKLKKNKK